MSKSILKAKSSKLKTNNQGQSSAYVIIFIIVIIFAVMISGGGGSLFSGNTPSSVTDTPPPTIGPSTSPTSPTSPTSSPWSLVVDITSCDKTNPSDPNAAGSLTAKGTAKGYIIINTVDGAGKTSPHIVAGFEQPETKFKLSLLKSNGFSSNKWTVELYSGGGTVNNAIGGGKLQASVTKDPTNCQ